ncbi:MAG: peroxidase [Planctomycetes bacterium]|nr:peroxidase [Planctomycetota bacterium]
MESDWTSSGLDARRASILAYVDKLTTAPWDVRESDVQALRDQGLSDRDILDVCEVASYYAFVNRVADGLGVNLEDDPEPPPTSIS